MNALVPIGNARAKAISALSAGCRLAESGCWEWQRSTMNSGYGRVYRGFERDMSGFRPDRVNGDAGGTQKVNDVRFRFRDRPLPLP